MDMAVSQLPDHPGIQCSCYHMAVFNFFSDSVHMIHNPANLRGTEIGIHHKPCFLADHVAILLCNLICHTMALYTGTPVKRSQSITVSP